jgi:anti-sigma B factor antagonist
MQLQTQTRPKVISVQVIEDRIDAATAIQFKEQMRDVTRDGPALGAIVAVKKLLGPDRVLELASLTPTVEKVFRLTRMDSIFTIHPSLEVAVSHAASA